MRRHWRTILASVVGLAVAGAAVVHRHELGAALRRMGDLSAGWLLLLAALTAATVISAGFAVAAVHPGLGVKRSITVHQATIAATNTVVASGPVSLALRISMLRSWQQSDRAIAVSVIASNVLTSFRLWTVTLVVALIGATGTATEILDRWVFVVIALVSGVVLVASGLWWWFVVRHPRLAAWCGGWLQRLITRLRRRWQRIPDIDVMGGIEAFRRDVTALVRDRGRRIVSSSGFEMALMLVGPVMIARAFGITDATASTAEIVLAFGMVRLASALSPLPGGIGVSEFGTTLLLSRFGVPEPAVLATVVTHRAITFFVPLVLGGVLLGWWHRHSARSRPVVPTP